MVDIWKSWLIMDKTGILMDIPSNNIWLVVDKTSLENIKVNWDDFFHYMGKSNVPNHQPNNEDEFT